MSDDLKKCQYCCALLPTSNFAINPKGGTLYGKCETCRPIAAAKGREWKKTKKGKECVARSEKSEATRVWRASYEKSQHRRDLSKKWFKSPKGTAATGRARVKFLKKMQDDAATKLDQNTLCLAGDLCSGRSSKSPTFLATTGWQSEQTFLEHLQSTFASWMSWENYGINKDWSIEHIIPRSQYDFSNEDDVRRCWSSSNIRAFGNAANRQKMVSLLEAVAVPVSDWPAHWNGSIPMST